MKIFLQFFFAILDSSLPFSKTPHIAIIFLLGKTLRSKAKHSEESIPLLSEIVMGLSLSGIEFLIEFVSNDSVFFPLKSLALHLKSCHFARCFE